MNRAGVFSKDLFKTRSGRNFPSWGVTVLHFLFHIRHRAFATTGSYITVLKHLLLSGFNSLLNI